MKCRKILIMMVLAIFIFGMASVCASEGDDAVIAGEDNPAVELSQAGTYEIISTDGNELLGQTENDGLISEGNSGTFAELQANITAAKQGSTITLTKNYERESGFDVEGIVIGKSITIDGNGFKIDAQGNSRILKITADNVILKNIIFTNGKTTENGGAVFFQKSGTVTNCSFINNHNGEGAVFFVGKGEVTNSNFADNYADYGAAIYFSDSGNVTNCNFTDNLAAKDGGAVYFQNSGDVRDCNFIKSTSKNNGGAVFFEKSGTVINCNFADSTASNTGGAVYFSSEGKVTDCSFDDSSAAKYGGAVYFTSDGDVANCNFANNTAKMGNAIYSNSKCTVSDCDFTDNPLTKGAIHSVTGDIALSNNGIDVDDVVKGRNFTEIQKLIDRANDGDEITIDGLYEGFGIPIRITKSLTLIGQNNATLDARKLSKILYITADNVILKNIQFTNGYADNEGAVYFYRTGTVENCNFNNNEVTGEKGSGGAIYFNGAGNVINSIFTANKATRNGGAVYVESQSINNNFSSQFYNNYAGQSGGAIFFHNLVQNNNFECIFEDNYAGYGAGMFFSKNANANRFNSDFINNTAKSCGGAMFFYSTTDKNNFTGSFINNSALGQIDPANGNGGAITFKNVSTNSIFTCDFINNTASLNGGAVNYRETPKNIIFNANFTNNAAQRGGGVNFFKTFEDVIFNGELSENSAENGGALAAGYGTVKDISFNNNHANNGGAVYFAGSGLTVDCNFTNNSAAHNGGAVYISEKGNVVNCSFEDNTAAHDGGAVYSKSGTVENCNFTDNAAKNNGGAVSLSYPSNVANCHFADNSAKNGGALYFLNDNDNVINCSFVANEADSRGGAIFFMTKQQVNATNCYFEANSAPEGGAIFCYTWAVTADSIILKTDSDTTNNTLILSPKLDVYDFYSVYGSGENLTFDLTTHGGMPITNGNISMDIYFKDNAKEVANYTFLRGEDWTVDLPVGSYYALINTEYEEFEPIFRTIVITMPDVQFYVNVTSLTTSSKTVNITAKSDIPKNLLWDGKLLFILPNGTQINATYGTNGTWWAVHTFDAYGEYKVNATYVGLDNVTINNGTITINKVNSTITLENIVLDYGESKNVTVTTTGATGITAKIDGNNVTVINNYTIQIPVLDAGTYNLTVTTIPDNDHNPVTKEVNITVNRVNSTLTVSDIVFDYGSSGYTVVSLTGADGVNATVVGQPKAVVKVNGTNITVSDLDAGTYTLTVTTIADKNHNNITKNATITVNKVNATLTVNDVVLDYGETKNITVTTEGATGITAKIDGVNVTVNGYTIPISGLGAGNHTLSVTTIPDDNHNPVTVTSKITVNKVESTLTVGDIVFDYDGEGSGDVSFTGASEVTANVINQPKAVVSVNDNKITVSGLAAGTYTLNVTTVPDENHTAVTETAGITVNKINSTLTLDDVVLDYGEIRNVTVATEGATGITAKIDGVNVTVSNYTIPISGLGAGNYTLTVTTIADKNHNPVTKEANITVNKVNATLTVNDVVLDYGETKNITVTTEGATGITAKIDGVDVTVSNYIIPISGLGAGNYTLTVTTIADKNHNPVTKEVNITVNKLSTEIILANETLDLKVGDEVPVLANLTPAGAGNLTFTSSNEDLVFVEDNVTIVANSQGQAIITVSFAGNENYTAAENKTITVNVALNDASVRVENDTLNLKVDETCAINATINPDTIMLHIKYTSSNESVATVDKNGIVTAVGEGRAIITLEVGDDEIYAKNSITVTVTVSKINTTADVSIPENITVGDNSTVNVIFPADATGNVTVKVDGEVVDTVPVKDGNADVTIPSMTAGKHTVEIDYSGDDKYNPINETKDITVSKNDITPEIIIPSDIEFGDNATVDIKLPGDASGNVTLTVDGREINTVPVTNGTASVKLPALDAGNHTAEIAYSGDDKYNSVSKTATISVGKDSTNLSAANVTATYKVNKYLVIKLTDSQGNPLANSTVTVDLNGAKNYTTDENGQVKVKVSNLVPKTYTAKISFAGNDNYLGSEATAKVVVKKATPKITAKAKTFKTTTKTKKYTITLKDNTGKAIKNAKVTLKVNGKTYKATTNSKGKATFKITKLTKKGTFKATITYKGNKYFKKVTKKVNIKVKSVWKTVQKGSKKKAIVKKIQRALKKHGYYLTYNGHYLKVDGIFWDYTKMAVKQFQNTKKLKVTGKVDEKTAKKLGLI